MSPAEKKSKFSDRTVGLILFGVLQVILGMVVAGFAGFLALVGSKMPAEEARIMPWVTILYLALGVLWIVLGVASMMAKRWARALTLLLSWPWLVLGVFGSLFMVYAVVTGKFPPHHQALGENAGAVMVGMIIGLLVVLFFFLVPPLAMVVFYSTANVKATCEDKNPKPSWTDSQPLPLLGFCLFVGLGAVGAPFFMASMNYTTLLFGCVVSGITGFMAILGLSLIEIYLVWGFWTRQWHAWWAAVAFSLLLYLPMVFTYTPENLEKVYEQMGYSQTRIELIMQNAENFPMGWMMIFGLVVYLGYVIYLRRYFPQASSKSSKSRGK